MPTNNEDVYEYVHAAQRTGMFKMLKVEFILSVLSVMLILVSLLLTKAHSRKPTISNRGMNANVL